MSTDKPAPGDHAPRQASLDAALDNLEHILEERRPTPDQEHGTQAIPLLDDVVAPGAATDPVETPLAALPPDEYAALCRRIAERLSSEIEIIVNERFEEAIKAALGDAKRSIRNHLDIVLPEIVEELRQSTPRDE